MTSLRTIDIDKLEAEIDKRDTACRAIARGRSSIPLDDGIAHARLMAERNALIAVFNSLR